ncbi:hypothetical protein F4T82_00100 [Acinetobacter lwoffii]|nr:hypothetical protein [Acinetobacter lwoffii]OIU82904.1 hypothetical protein BFN00_12315 [Acinetobacter sp. AR2-3]RDC51196.1 hypothetical protein DVA85_14920 [Acinetobacter sp. RIT592]
MRSSTEYFLSYHLNLCHMALQMYSSIVRIGKDYEKAKQKICLNFYMMDQERNRTAIFKVLTK